MYFHRPFDKACRRHTVLIKMEIKKGHEWKLMARLFGPRRFPGEVTGNPSVRSGWNCVNFIRLWWTYSARNSCTLRTSFLGLNKVVEIVTIQEALLTRGYRNYSIPNASEFYFSCVAFSTWMNAMNFFWLFYAVLCPLLSHIFCDFIFYYSNYILLSYVNERIQVKEDHLCGRKWNNEKKEKWEMLT